MNTYICIYMYTYMQRLVEMNSDELCYILLDVLFMISCRRSKFRRLNSWDFTDGWSDFVASERIVTGDIGHFVLVEPHRLLMKLYGPDGELRPLASRPLVWNLFLAYGNQVDAQQPVGGHGGAPEIVGSPENAAQDHVGES